MITYTVWSRGRELGYSTLAWARCMENTRVGWFFPSDEGMSLMPAVTGKREAWLNLMAATKRGEHDGLSPEEVKSTSAYAQILAAAEHEKELQLELRGPDGKVIPTEEIEIRDTELFVPEIHGTRHGDADIELTPAEQAAVDEAVAYFKSLPQREPWEPEPEMGRYQIAVTLFDEWDIP